MRFGKAQIVVGFLLPLFITVSAMAAGTPSNAIPTVATVDTQIAGRSSAVAAASVLRIFCPEHGTVGTGFLHSSGKILTAAHVVDGCTGLVLVLANGEQMPGSIFAVDADHDLALVHSSKPIKGPAFKISSATELPLGSQVATWGYPGGYGGLAPLLSVGYVSGTADFRLPSGKSAKQLVVNAAFNSGNSGGPLILIESGEVVGVVSSKLAPLSPTTMQILQALANQHSGFSYNATAPDGSQKTFSEGQLIGMVLEELRSEVQLVIGEAATIDEIRGFLSEHKISP